MTGSERGSWEGGSETKENEGSRAKESSKVEANEAWKRTWKQTRALEEIGYAGRREEVRGVGGRVIRRTQRRVEAHEPAEEGRSARGL